MAKDRYLTCRNGVWYYQRAVPDYVRPHVGRKQLWRHSLKTRDVKEAARRARSIIDHYDAICAKFQPMPLELERKISADMGALGFSLPAGQQWDMEAVKAAHGMLEQAMGALIAGRRTLAAEFTKTMGEQDAAAVLNDGAIGTALKDQQQALLRAICMVEQTQAEMRGDVVPDIIPPAPITTILDLFNEWKRTAKPTEQSEHEYRRALERFTEVCGSIDAKTITREDVIRFRDALLAQPKHLKGDMRNKPLPEVLKAFDGQEYERVSPSTVDKVLGFARTILRWAYVDGKIPSNPGETVKVQHVKQERRLPFSKSELEALFTALQKRRKRDSFYWVTVLGLYTGCRAGELVPLEACDVQQHEGVWFLDVREDEANGRRLKNESSRRPVPLHPDLVSLGFLAFVKGCKGRLFPDYKPQNGKFAHYFSRQFGTFKQAAGVTDTRKVFHSFRHLIADMLRDAEATDSVKLAIMGHTGQNVGDKYGSGASLKVKADSMARIRVPIKLETIAIR